MRRWLLAVLVALAVIGPLACSSRDARPHDQATGTVEATATASAGDGGTQPLPAALQQILDDVAKVRELAPPPALKASLVARSDLPALLDRLLTEDDRKLFGQTTTLYRLLGHLRKDQDYLSVYQSFGAGSILGLYSPLDDELWVVHDDGADIDWDNLPRQEKSTLAHELVHAIQDYHFKLDAVYDQVKDDLDLSGTWTSVVEGDAVTYEGVYSRQFTMALSGGRAFALATISAPTDVPPSIARELLFPYTTGADWIRTIRQKKGAAAINAMLTNPPKGMAYILHPDLLDSGWQPATVGLPDLGPSLGGGWKRESGGAFGEFQLRNYLQLKLRALDASAAAAGWAGDHYDVYTNGADSIAAFRVWFRDANEAAEFAKAQQSFLVAAQATITKSGDVTYGRTTEGNVTATVSVSGDEVLFLIASSQNVAERAMSALIHG